MPGKARMAMRRWQRASPAGWTAGNGGGRAARRAGAAAGGGARRRLCREGEGAGLGAKPSEGREEMLPVQGIEPRLTGAAESRRRAAIMKEGNGLGLGFEGNGGRSCADKERAREGAARHARMNGTCPEDGRRRRAMCARGAEQNRGGEGEADRWARRGFLFYFLFFLWAVTTLPP